MGLIEPIFFLQSITILFDRIGNFLDGHISSPGNSTSLATSNVHRSSRFCSQVITRFIGVKPQVNNWSQTAENAVDMSRSMAFGADES